MAPSDSAASDVQFTPTRQQRRLEETLSGDHVPSTVLPKTQNPSESGIYAPDDDGYIGVSDEYKNSADDRQEPFSAEDGVEARVEEKYEEVTTTSTPVTDGPVQERVHSSSKENTDETPEKDKDEQPGETLSPATPFPGTGTPGTGQ